MGNTGLGILAISMSLWAADLGAGHYGALPQPASPQTALSSHAPCVDGDRLASDDSDLEVVVCGAPLRRP